MRTRKKRSTEKRLRVLKIEPICGFDDTSQTAPGEEVVVKFQLFQLPPLTWCSVVSPSPNATWEDESTGYGTNPEIRYAIRTKPRRRTPWKQSHLHGRFTCPLYGLARVLVDYGRSPPFTYRPLNQLFSRQHLNEPGFEDLRILV